MSDRPAWRSVTAVHDFDMSRAALGQPSPIDGFSVRRESGRGEG